MDNVLAVIIGVAILAVLFGEMIRPIALVSSLFNPPYLSVQHNGNQCTVFLNNRGVTATKMMYNITADSESIQFTPPTDVTDTMSPGDNRMKNFSTRISGSEGSYTFVVHTYVNNSNVWKEVANTSITVSNPL